MPYFKASSNYASKIHDALLRTEKRVNVCLLEDHLLAWVPIKPCQILFPILMYRLTECKQKCHLALL